MNGQSTSAIITDAIPHYPNALAAIREFRRDIQDRCSRVLRANLSQLNVAMGSQFEAGDIRPVADPEQIPNAEWKGDTATLGAKLVKKSEYTFCCFFWWEMEDAGMTYGVSVSIMFDKSAPADAFKKELDKVANLKTYRIDNESAVQLCFDPSEREAIESGLKSVFKEWLRIWKKLGNVQKFLR